MKFHKTLIVALALLLAPTLAFSASGNRLRFAVTSTTAPDPGGGLGAQTVYFGPNTLVGNGGAPICEAPCVQPFTFNGGAPLNYTRDDDGLLVPKDGNASTAYNGLRTTGDLTGASFTIVDALGKTKAITVIVSEARAGKFTIRDKASADGSGTYNSQLAAALARASYGEHIAWRGGSRFNTPTNTGTYVGATPYRLRNTRTIPGAYTGENPVTIRPETGGTVTLGHLLLDGQNNTVPGGKRLDGLRWQGIDFYGETDELPLVQSVALVSNQDFYDSTFRSVEGDWLNTEVARADGVIKDTNGARWRFYRNTFEFLGKGIVAGNDPGTPNGGAATYSDPTGVYHEVVDNVFRHVYTDTLAMPCATGAVVTGNLFTDKATGVVINGVKNPFDTSSPQPHGDAIQFDDKACGWGRLAGPTVVGNVITRGNGRNSLPWWTVANGYANPSTPGPSCCLVPDPTKGYGDYQAIFRSNPSAGETNHAAYNVVWVNPVITHNFAQISMGNGIVYGPVENPVIEYNTMVVDDPGPANLITSPFAATSILGGPISGTSGRVRYNAATAAIEWPLASGASVDVGTGSGIGGSTNVLTPRLSFGSFYETAAPTRRTRDEARDAFKPKIGGGLFVNDNQPAGVWCPSGALRTAEAC